MKKIAAAIANRAAEAIAVGLITFAIMFSIVGMMDLATGALGLLAAWGSWGAISAVLTCGMLGFALLVVAD